MDFLSVSNLSKRFGGIVALDGANCAARAGEVHALLGENGAGKSTFIQILSGALQHDGGKILLDGTDYHPQNPNAASAKGVAAVFQELSLVPDLSVEENIWFRREPLTFLGTRSAKRLRDQTEALLDRYRFPPIRPDRELRSLTLAERQIVEVAKALAKEPRVLILDEATSALPAAEAEWLLRLSRQIAAEGRLVVFISHRMGEVRAVADRLTIFRNGSTVAAHETKAVTDDEIVAQMIGRRLDRLYPPRTASRTERVALCVRGLRAGRRLRDASFSLFEGEILGIGGLQGHGQRELFEALFGALPTKAGTMELWGEPTAAKGPRDTLLRGREGIALVPEDRRNQGLMLPKSVRENLTLSAIPRFARAGLLDKARETALVEEMVSFLRIKAATPDQPVGTLSGGNQQKVVFGKMLLTEARVLLLYDPARGVDVGTKGEIFQLMRDLTARGYAILFYSSDLAELVHMADRVLVMREGRVAATLAGDGITEQGILGAAFIDRAA